MIRIVQWSAGVEVPAEPVVGERRDVADDSGVDGRDGDQQREAVEPAHEPAVLRPDGELGVLVERSRHGIVARELAEDEGDEEHPDHREPRSQTYAARPCPRRG